MFGTMLLVVALILGAAEVSALTPTKRIASYGSWAVYTMPVMIAMDGDSGVLILDDPYCAAQVGTDESALLRLAFLRDGMNIVQVASAQWEFARRSAKVEFDGKIDLVFMDARYAESFIERASGGNEAAQVELMMEMMAEGGDEPIAVVDDRNRTVVRFPTNGMAAALQHAKQCAASYQ